MLVELVVLWLAAVGAAACSTEGAVATAPGSVTAAADSSSPRSFATAPGTVIASPPSTPHVIDSTSPASPAPSSSMPLTSMAPPSTDGAPSPMAPKRAWTVATTTRTFIDAERGRTLQTTIYYPLGSTIGFPLVLMAHGYLLPGNGYDRMLKAVAAAGYVVASPEFPHNTGNGGDGLRSDIVNQPRDLSFVADQVIAMGIAPALGASGNPVTPVTPAIIDPGRIGVVGHSDGGLTATAMAYGQQFRDPRVAAAVSLTGGIALFPGAFFAPDSPPLLAVHARDDSTNPYSASVNLFNQIPPGRARFLLSIDAGGHIDPYMFATGRADVGEAIAAFLDLTLKGDAPAADRLRAIAAGPGLSLQAAS